MKISNWTTNVANQTYKDLDLPGFTRFVAKIYQLRITRFWGKSLNSNFCLCKKFDISQLCVQQTQKDYCYHHLTEEAFQPTLYMLIARSCILWTFIRPLSVPFLHRVFPGVSSNDPHEQMHNCTCCICVAFLQCVFLNVPSICLAERINSHTDYICSFLFHCV